jgi:flavodoxin
MTPIGQFYGTDTGFTEIVVKLLEEEFSLVVPELLTIHNIADVSVASLQQYDHLIIGCPPGTSASYKLIGTKLMMS